MPEPVFQGIPEPGLDEAGQKHEGAPHPANDETVQRRIETGGVRDNQEAEPERESCRDRKVGGGRRHRPLPAQLQRRPADLLRVHEQRHLQAEEDVGQGLENGGWRYVRKPSNSVSAAFLKYGRQKNCDANVTKSDFTSSARWDVSHQQPSKRIRTTYLSLAPFSRRSRRSRSCRT